MTSTQPSGAVRAHVDALFSGCRFVGWAHDGRWLIYSEESGWGCRVYDVIARRELVDPDPDYPRFWVEDERFIRDALEDVAVQFASAA